MRTSDVPEGLTRRQLLSAIAAVSGGRPFTMHAQPTQLLRVGPTRRIKTIGEAAREAPDGSVVEVDAGDYLGDVAVWAHKELTVRAVGGRVRVLFAGRAAEDKGLWVVRGGSIRIEGFDFEGARVSDRNGAGIRFERGTLHVRDCGFRHNENGLLTANDRAMQLSIEDSEFGFNGHGDGQSHNLYVGRIGMLRVIGSYFHHANVGHLLKSRAAMHQIVYNRLTDEADGRASYELEFPEGGDALVMGNVIAQGPLTENPCVMSYGAEGYGPARNRLRLIHNTLIDRLPRGGVFLRVAPGSADLLATENLLCGNSHFEDAAPGRFNRNFTVDWRAFADPESGDFRLKAAARIVAAAPADPDLPQPDREYVHPHSTRVLTSPAAEPGAVQSLAR